MEVDPLGLVDGASVYGYALQNPTNRIDPTGMYDMGGTPGAGGVINNSNRSIVAVDMDNHRHKVVRPGESLARGSSEDWDMVWDG